MKTNQQHAIFIGSTIEETHQGAHQYTDAFQLYGMFGQITRVLLRKNNVGPSQAINQYLQQCSKGQHVLLKSFSAFSKGALNRLCFLNSFLKIFEVDTNSRNGLDYYQLFRLLCSDFPKEYIAKSANLLTGDINNQEKTNQNMTVILDSKSIVNSLYFFLVYNQFSDALLKFFETKKQRGLIQLYNWLKQWNQKNKNVYERPPLEISIQVLLRHMRNNNVLGTHAKVIFLTDATIEDYLKQKLEKEGQQVLKISIQKFLKSVIEASDYAKLVDQNLGMFQIQSNWATEAAKIINNRQGANSQPINAKKVKPKK